MADRQSLPKPYYDRDGITIYCADCRDILPHLDPVDLVLTDPPYNATLIEEWDQQWMNDESFLAWLEPIIVSLITLMVDNGTLYCFSSPRMTSRVEGLIAKYAKIIASCVWDKGSERKGVSGSGIDVTKLRTFWSSGTERCTVAEHGEERFQKADDLARQKSGYGNACQQAKRNCFGDYLRSEIKRAGVTQAKIASLFPSHTGGLTGCVSNWLLGHNCPTAEQYKVMREFLNAINGDQYLQQNYEYLKQNYEYSKQNYEYLKQNYEYLRRPFNLERWYQWGDIWRWSVPRQERIHPAQKPLAMIRELIQISSRKENVLLDPFMGSGTTLRAAKDLGRRAIGIEIEEKYCEIAVKRLAQQVLDFETSVE